MTSPAQKGTPAMKDDVAKVAEGLTPGEKRVLLRLCEGPAVRPRWGTIPWVSLFRKGLCEWGDYSLGEQVITPLGLEVRRILQETPDHDQG